MGKHDDRCVRFLQWALPRLQMRWGGFRKVRGQVCKRLGRRLGALGLADFDAYRAHLAREAGEWAHLDRLCRITISRFYRDRALFDRLGEWLINSATDAKRPFRAWSVGCASGEEPYTLSLLWDFRVRPHHPGAALSILATDSDPALLERARRACYPPGSLRELPPDWVRAAFHPLGGEQCLGRRWTAPVQLRQDDIRQSAVAGLFTVILCRNLAFTYFDAALQHQVLATLRSRLHGGGLLVLGSHERLPRAHPGFEALATQLPLYRRTDSR